MAEHISEHTSVGGQVRTGRADSSEPKRLAVGGVAFAVCMLVITGMYHVILGLAALIDDKFYVVGRDYVYEFDVTVWGWLYLISGAVVLAAGLVLFTGKMWARIVGITVAVVSAVGNFFFIPYSPIWSVIIISLNVLVIWSLAHYGTRQADNW